MKKPKGYKPQKRKTDKPTTGKATFIDVLYMGKEKNEEGIDVIYATCTCDKWRSSNKALTITAVAREAKEHAIESGHQFRKHD